MRFLCFRYRLGLKHRIFTWFSHRRMQKHCVFTMSLSLGGSNWSPRGLSEPPSTLPQKKSPFLVRVWSKMDPFSGPFWSLIWAKTGSKKCAFSGHDFEALLDHLWDRQGASTIVNNDRGEGPHCGQKVVILCNLGSIWGPFWSLFGSFWGPFLMVVF